MKSILWGEVKRLSLIYRTLGAYRLIFNNLKFCSISTDVQFFHIHFTHVVVNAYKTEQ